MIELQLLGSTSLTSPDRELSGLLGRRKHMALLAYLAMEPGRHHARSVLCGLLWPESDESHARRSLRVVLHRLRNELGDDAILSRSDGAVAANRERIACDVPRLLEAAAGARGHEIAELYGGPLLDGFYTDAPPFDRWIEERRAALEQEAADGLRAATRNALGRSAWEDATALSDELLRIRPHDVEALGIRVEALLALDRAGRAVKELDAFRDRFVDELELPPPDALRELEEQIRERSRESEPSVAASGEGPPELSAPDGTEAETGPHVEHGAEAEAPETEPASVEGEGTGVSRGWWWAAVGVGAVGLSVLALVLPDPGTVEPSGASPDVPPHVAALEAREWMDEGRRLGRVGLYGEAVAALRAAVSADPEWGEAYHELALAAHWGGWPDVSRAALDEALARLDAMSPLARARTEAFDLDLRGRVLAARDAYLEILDRFPDDVATLTQLGELEFHWGPSLGVPAEASRDRFEAVLEIRPGHPEALSHLARLDAIAGDGAAVRRRLDALDDASAGPARVEMTALARILAGAPLEAARGVPGDSYVPVLRSAASARAPSGSLDAFFEEMARTAPGERERVLALTLRAQMALKSGRVGEAREWLDRLGPDYSARRDEMVAAAVTLPFLLVSPGGFQELDRRLAEREGDLLIGPSDSDFLAPAIYEPRRIFLRSLLRGPGQALSGPDPFRAVTQRTWVDTANINLMRRVLEARHRMNTGRDPEPALEILGPPDLPPDRRYPGVLSYPTAHLRYWRARILRNLGRDEAALAWYRTFPDPRGYDLAFLPAVLVERGQVERRLGQDEAARQSLRRAVELLEGSDPPYRSLLAAARRELAGL